MSLSGDNPKNVEEDFKLVTYKRKQKKKQVYPKNTNVHPNSFISLNFDQNTIVRRIENAKTEINSSDLFASFKASLREGIEALNKPKLTKIVCLGLGRFVQSTIARYQLALCLCLRDIYRTQLNFYDPVFTEVERNLLGNFGCEVLSENVEGKYKISETTVFYLPHCPKELTNNLLWSNWGLNLHNCIIISNSFTQIVDNRPRSFSVQNSFGYLHKILPYTVELAVINNFKYYEVFNDTAIHVFPLKNLCLVDDDFWQNCREPTYVKDETEIVTKNSDKTEC